MPGAWQGVRVQNPPGPSQTPEQPRPGDPRVVAVVVAHERRELLLQALDALAAQTRRPDALVVVDNASTDGSPAAVRGWAAVHPELPVDLVPLERNTGGAGGFAAGAARALRRHEPDLLWLMDDDTVPRPTALARALAARAALDGPAGPPAVVASAVVWGDGRAHPMNTPRPRPRPAPGEREAAAAAGCVPIRSASFVAMLVDAAAVRADGLPQAGYFLWNDDFEFSTRLLRHRRGVFAPASVVEHRTRVFGGTDADPGERFVWEVRNKVWLFTRDRTLDARDGALYGGATLRRWVRTVARSPRRALLLRGLADGLAQGLGGPPPPTAQVLAGLGEVSRDVLAVEAAAGRPLGTAAAALPVPQAEPADGGLPPFSVLLPVWAGDDPGQARRAVRSVTLEQELRPAEVVLVRDGPVPPALAALLAELAAPGAPDTGGVPVRLVPLARNVGLARALEAGLVACAHDVVARMDADDVSLPQRFARQLPLVAAGADLVGSGLLEIGEDEHDVVGRRTPPVGAQRIASYARFHDPFNHPTVVYRRSAVAAAGGYRDLPLMEDYWLFARMIAAGARAENLPEPLVLYRVGPAAAGGAYARRGGVRLWRSEVLLQAHLRREGFTSSAQALRNVAVRGGYRFVPLPVRRALYRRFIAARGAASSVPGASDG